MNPVLATLLLVDLGFIGALPRIFFRPGKLNASWWLTAAPFGVTGLAILGAWTGWLEPQIELDATLGAVAGIVATLLAAASIVLIALTLGTHKRAISLWHQQDDRPESIVTEGPYARIRHPFYAAFLLGLLAILVALPHLITLGAFAYAFAMLSLTAAREERRLSISTFGSEYRAYMQRTGRFHPRLRSSS